MRIIKPLYILGAFFALILFVNCSSSVKNDTVKVHVKLLTEVDAINKQCPINLTSSIRLDSCVLLENNDMINYYTWIDSTTTYSIGGLKTLEIDAKRQMKTDPSMYQLRSYGITFQYKYFDLNKKNIYSFNIFPSDYN